MKRPLDLVGSGAGLAMGSRPTADGCCSSFPSTSNLLPSCIDPGGGEPEEFLPCFLRSGCRTDLCLGFGSEPGQGSSLWIDLTVAGYGSGSVVTEGPEAWCCSSEYNN